MLRKNVSNICKQLTQIMTINKRLFLRIGFQSSLELLLEPYYNKDLNPYGPAIDLSQIEYYFIKMRAFLLIIEEIEF